MAKKKIGVLLSGCGVMDGSEIHEATLTLFFLDVQGAEAVCMAPNKEQTDVVNHAKSEPVAEKRNVLVEAARIARGNIRDLKTVRPDELDAVIIPGGFGAAKNLCTFAKEGAECSADETVAGFLREMHRRKKPIGALCIAPAVLARVFGGELSPELTIGTDAGTAAALEKMGAKHRNAQVDEVIIDSRNRLLTTPCYMMAKSIKDVGAGAETLVARILEMC